MSIDTRAQRAADGVHASARGVDPMTQITDLKREVKNRQRTAVVVTAAAVLVLVLGVLAFSTRWLGSDELGRGPFGDSYWSLHVRDGQIVYASPQFPFEANGFSAEMWEPFLAFVDASYPGDADVMYNDNRSEPAVTPEALQLWEQHVSDYVASETAG